MNKALSIILLIIIPVNMIAQQQPEVFQTLSFGSIKPTGWLKEQMQKDINGFVGNLDLLVPELINDPIYGESRLQKNSKAKDLGNLKAGDVAGDEQYKWWNSETQSNWWDGYMRNVFLLDDKNGIEKVNHYVASILATQDEDGYIGIYDVELRYKFNSENGELWSKASLYRGLLAYYEFTHDEKVFKAVTRAVENVMQNYPIHASSPFSSGTSFNGGVSHGLTFTDVLERMYFHTQDEKYRQYALFLYQDFSNTYQSEADVQLKNILNPTYKLKSHGVHTFEHIRALIIAAYTDSNMEIDNALKTYLDRIKQATTLSGGAIGDEWIAERHSDATHTGYEYCSLQELLDSYCLLFQKTGNAETGDLIENTFYNAAQGSRNPQHSCIAYLKTDNSYEMLGSKNGEIEPDRKQTRYKYSPAHQDVAVCCNPNAGRISPYFIQNSWMKENEKTLVATLLMPNIVETTLNGTKISIENITHYPYENSFTFKIQLEKNMPLTLKIRKPIWVQNILTSEKYTIENDFIVINRTFMTSDEIQLSFSTDVVVKVDPNGAHYFSYGALLYAKPILAEEIAGKVYGNEFTDFTYKPQDISKYAFAKKHKSVYKNGIIKTQLINLKRNKKETVELIPFGKTILRQTTF
ncbi:MAG: glycoside hydrolase family 127 protein [Flavobacteriaceae bacterium]|nr:glycoside hydrolase family 127 protein [Flavobacteriaceae bacterium]